MNKYEKTIETLGLSDTDKRNALLLTYKGLPYVFYTDGAGLDFFDFNDRKANEDEGHELFCAIVDTYRSIGLLAAAIKAGAIITPVKKSGNYNLYKIKGAYELWKLTIENENSYCAGFVSNPDNMETAIDVAEEEMRCLMAEIN